MATRGQSAIFTENIRTRTASRTAQSCCGEGGMQVSNTFGRKSGHRTPKTKGDVDILRCMTAHELRELTGSLSQFLLAAQREHSIKCSALDSEVLCMACCEKRRCTVTEPCKHLSLCLECFERSGDRCPQCRASINGSIQVFV